MLQKGCLHGDERQMVPLTHLVKKSMRKAKDEKKASLLKQGVPECWGLEFESKWDSGHFLACLTKGF